MYNTNIYIYIYIYTHNNNNNTAEGVSYAPVGKVQGLKLDWASEARVIPSTLNPERVDMYIGHMWRYSTYIGHMMRALYVYRYIYV